MSDLNEARNRAMLADYLSGMRQVDICEKYGISQGTVSKIVGGSPAQMAGEVRRLRRAIRSYFMDRTSSQIERDLTLWQAIDPTLMPEENYQPEQVQA